ncbi:MAG: flagellin [candidate division Zixibacteria bacterium]|nr:flagellin [candidate division Zixibacteria bacterium]
MSLRINHNLAALNANRNLKLTTDSLNKSMQKLSSGFRINAAADDPAGLMISEQFRSQIAGLNRAIQNSEGSITMIQTAEGALTEINNLLISMRELAIHAANEGFNDTDQLAADQAEISNAIKTIDRIAANTQFGTKKILDGTKDNIATITTAGNSGLNIKTSNLNTGMHSISATKTADSTATLNTTSLGISLNNTDGDPYNLQERIHTIDVVQASDVAKKTSGTISLTDAFGNGLTLATTSAAAQILSAAAFDSAHAADGETGTYTFVLNYQENGETPTGNQTLQITVEEGDQADEVASKLQTAINQNAALAGKLTVTGSNADASSLWISAANAGGQYSFQVESVSTDASSSLFNFTSGTSSRGVSTNLLQMEVITDKWTSGRTATATIGGTYTSLSTLVSDINTALRTANAFGTITGTTNDIKAEVVNNNRIQFSTQDEGSAYSIKLTANSTGTDDLIHVLNLTQDTLANTGTDALVRFDDYTNSINSVTYLNPTDNVVTLYNKAVGTSGRGSVSIKVDTALNGLNLGNLLLDVKAAKFDVRLDGGPATSITAGLDTTVYNADRSESLIINYDLTALGGSETINNIDQSLVFQIGANVGQTAKIGIRNMSASTLGQSLPGNMFRSLADIDVTTVQGAQDAQSIIDNAITEVSTTRGTLGSFQKNTLESNLRNLRIASQNLTSSESMIRDTDMAEEMSEFTKNQILVQTGMAMLAQSNQIPQVVLSLF